MASNLLRTKAIAVTTSLLVVGGATSASAVGMVEKPVIELEASAVNGGATTLSATVSGSMNGVSGIRFGRDGVDTNDYGSWSITKAPATSATQTLTNLDPQESYTLFAELIPLGIRSEVKVGAGSTSGNSVSDDDTAPDDTAPDDTASGGTPMTPQESADDQEPADDVPSSGEVDLPGESTVGEGTQDEQDVVVAGSGPLAKFTLPERGWFSGAAGSGTAKSSPEFGQWRGEPIDAMSTWADKSNGSVWAGGVTGSNSGPASGFKGLLDVAIGGPSNYAETKNGSMDAKVRTMLTRLRENRTIDGEVQPTIIRPFHEMNGTWYAWSVKPGEENDFKATARRWREIGRDVFPEAAWSFGANGETTSGIQVADLWEDGVWDIVGADRYNQYPYIGRNRNGDFTSWEAGSTRGSATNPIGVEKWRQFAEERGVPLYFPEYGNNGYSSKNPANSGDDPYWVNEFFSWVKEHRGAGAGNVFAEMYFNIGGKEENRWPVYNSNGSEPRHPAVSKAYADIFPVKG